MNRQPFLVGVLIAIATYFYCMWFSSPATTTHLSSSETELWDRLEPVRLGLFFLAVAGFAAALALCRRRRRMAAYIWAVVIMVIIIRRLIPGYPAPSGLPYAEAVFWLSLLTELYLCRRALVNTPVIRHTSP